MINNLRAYRSDAFSYINHCFKKYNLIFADPPYDLKNIPNIPDIIFEKQSKKSFERKRKYAYLGSRMHLFRTLWAEPKITDFVIMDQENLVSDIRKLVMQGNNGQKYLKNDGDLQVGYNKNLSRITFLKPEVYFDKTGYFDAAAIEWDGEMARQRIADWLPNEYEP